jgi:hypothetical protein
MSDRRLCPNNFAATLRIVENVVESRVAAINGCQRAAVKSPSKRLSDGRRAPRLSPTAHSEKRSRSKRRRSEQPSRRRAIKAEKLCARPPVRHKAPAKEKRRPAGGVPCRAGGWRRAGRPSPLALTEKGSCQVRVAPPPTGPALRDRASDALRASPPARCRPVLSRALPPSPVPLLATPRDARDASLHRGLPGRGGGRTGP